MSHIGKIKQKLSRKNRGGCHDAFALITYEAPNLCTVCVCVLCM